METQLEDFVNNFDKYHKVHGVLIGVGAMIVSKPLLGSPNNRYVGIASGLGAYFYMMYQERKNHPYDIPHERIKLSWDSDIPEGATGGIYNESYDDIHYYDTHEMAPIGLNSGFSKGWTFTPK